LEKGVGVPYTYLYGIHDAIVKFVDVYTLCTAFVNLFGICMPKMN